MEIKPTDLISKEYVINYIKDISREFQTEILNDETIVINKSGTKPKKAVCFIMELPQIIITNVDGCNAEFSIQGKAEPTVLCNREVFCDGESKGMIRVIEGEKDEFKLVLWNENSVDSLDILSVEYPVRCKGDIVYNSGASPIISIKILEKLLKLDSARMNDICFTVSFSDITLPQVISSLDSEEVYIVGGAKADEKFKCGSGAGIVVKDGYFISDEKILRFMNDTAEKNNIKTIAYSGKENAYCEKISIHNRGNKVIPVYFPIEYSDTSCPMCNISDGKAVAELVGTCLSANKNQFKRGEI